MSKIRGIAIALWIASGAIAYVQLPADACEVRREYIGGNRYWHCRNLGSRIYTSVTGCPTNVSFRRCHRQQREESLDNLNRLIGRRKPDQGGGGGAARLRQRSKRSLVREFNTAGLRRVSPLPNPNSRMRRIQSNQRRGY